MAIKFLNSVNADSGVLYVDAANDRVGIGTTSPDGKLHIYGGAGEAKLVMTHGTSDHLSGIIGTNGGGFAVEDNNFFAIWHQDIANVGTETGLTERMRITSAGNVGIGNTSPARKLQIGDGTADDRIRVYFSDNTYTEQTGYGIEFSRPASYIRPLTDNINNLYIGQSTKTWATLQTDATSHSFNNNGSTLMYIASDGDVGIGTTSPAYKLDVVGTMRIAGNEDATNLRLAANLATVSGSAYQNYNELLFENTGATYGNAGIRHLGNAWLDSKSALAFFTSSNTGSFDERMRIDASGNVGIGTTSPSYKLDVAGDIQVQSAYFLRFANEWAIQQTGTNLNFAEVGSADGRLYLKAGGNIGIGTTSPTAPLTFGKSVYGAESSENYFRIKFQDQGGTHNDVGIGQPASGALGFNITAGNYFSFNNGTSGEIARLNGTGLGIGTTSPSYKLEVNADSTSGVMSVKNAANSRDTFRSENAAGTRTFNIGNDASGHGIVLVRNSSGTTTSYIAGSGDSYFNGGDVGIGTTSPSRKLQVESSQQIVSTFKSSSTTAGFITLMDGNTTSDSVVRFGAIGDNMVFYTSAERMRIDSSGNVGIGTTSPASKLHVTGTGSGTFRAESTSSDYPIRISGYQTTADAYIGVDQSNKLKFYVNSADRMVINSSGNVGIGTTSPSTRLEVAASATTSTDIAHFSNSNAVVKTKLALDSLGSSYVSMFDAVNNEDVRIRTQGLSWFNGGNVGIGTITPNALLHVYSTGNGEIEVERALGALFNIQSQSALAAIGTDSNHPLYLKTNAGTRLAITTAGNVGIGTTSPGRKLTVAGADNLLFLDSSGNSYVTIDRSATNRRSALVFSTAGNGTSNIPDNINWALGTADSDEVGDGTGFFIGTDTSATSAKLFITSSGNVGIGTSSPSEKLEVSGNILASGDITAYSDARIKENVETLPNALESVKAMRGVTYNKIGEEKQSIGVIAQEVQAVLPQLVSEHKDEMLSVAYGNITAVLIEAIKEQQDIISQLEERIIDLENRF